ncbi:unnamed protein product, partial [Brassica rapa]
FSCKLNSLVLSVINPSFIRPVVCFCLCFLQAKPMYKLFSK